MLTDGQMQTLAAALRAETDQTVVAALAVRNDVALTAWCNSASAVDAWNEAMGARELFEATDVTKFDGLTAGKRDAWRLLLEFAPIDFTRQKMRKAVPDVWGTTDAVAVLQDCRRKATRGEAYLGGNDATTNTVTAKKLNYSGSISLDDVSNALNRY
jgi:hypothetical protein